MRKQTEDAYQIIPFPKNRQAVLETLQTWALKHPIHAVADPMPPFAVAKKISGRLPNTQFIEVSDGGHLLLGDFDQARTAMTAFIWQHAGEPRPVAPLFERSNGKGIG